MFIQKKKTKHIRSNFNHCHWSLIFGRGNRTFCCNQTFFFYLFICFFLSFFLCMFVCLFCFFCKVVKFQPLKKHFILFYIKVYKRKLRFFWKVDKDAVFCSIFQPFLFFFFFFLFVCLVFFCKVVKLWKNFLCFLY